jgi:hypothetical protein
MGGEGPPRKQTDPYPALSLTADSNGSVTAPVRWLGAAIRAAKAFSAGPFWS